MEIKQLITFLALSDIKHFTKTADYLNYSQSNITSQIQQLENELQVKLFDRMGKTISLTNEGKALLPYAKKIVTLSKEAERMFLSKEKNQIRNGKYSGH